MQHVTLSIYAEYLFAINLVVLLALGSPLYNFKSSKPNRLASLFRQKINKALSYLKSSYQSFLSHPMAWSFACHTFFQNLLLGGKNELVDIATTKGNNTSAILHALIPVFAIAPPVVIALSFVT